MAVLFANVVNGADVGWFRAEAALASAAESFERLRVAGQVFRKELQRDEAVEARVLRLIYDTHPAAAKLFKNAVVRDGAAGKSTWARIVLGA